MTIQQLPQNIDDHRWFLRATGIGDPEFEKDLEERILSFEKRTRKMDISRIPSFYSETTIDARTKKILDNVLDKIDKGILSFLPPINDISFIQYYQNEYNNKAKKFYNTALPKLKKTFGISQNALHYFEAVPFRYMDVRNTDFTSFTDRYYKSEISQRERDLKRLSKSQEEKRDHIIKEIFDLKQEKEYLISLLKNEEDYDYGGVNLIFNPSIDFRKTYPTLAFTEKTKDQRRKATKFAQRTLKIYSNRNEKITLADWFIKDTNGVEIICHEDQEKKYLDRLRKNKDIVILEFKNETDLDEYKNWEKNGIPLGYKTRFYHKRISVYDKKEKVIVDIHLTNILSKIIKDSAPGFSHPERRKKHEQDIGEKYPSYHEFWGKTDFFFEKTTLIRGYEQDRMYFDLESKTSQVRQEFLYEALNRELNIFGINKKMDEMPKKIENISNARRYELGKKSNLSIVLDLILNEAQHSAVFSSLGYGVPPKLDSTLTLLLNRTKLAVELHTKIYKRTHEEKDWKRRIDLLYHVFNNV